MSGLFSYEGKRVVVTGGASGVGASLVTLLESLGDPEITVLDVREPTNLRKSQRWLRADLAEPASLAEIVEQLGPVDVLFNNAGVAGTAPPEAVFAINFLALRYLSEAVAEEMPPGGAVVNTASTGGMQWSSRAEVIGELLQIAEWNDALAWFGSHAGTLGIDPYSFTKECVHLYTMRSAIKYATKGLRINSVCPSPIDTPLLAEFRETFTDKVIDFSIIASGRLASPEDIASVLAFLGMEASRHVNGVNLYADGGSTAGLLTGTIDVSELMGDVV
jgi:NAD(P)-dependent dehydrogenase (short-subunit alcohol dehydrogenase family)